MTEKNVPLRRCMACMISREKEELLRFVKTDQGIFLDRTGKADGRGAYVCKDEACIEKLFKKRAFEKSYRCRVGDETLARLRNEVSDFIG